MTDALLRVDETEVGKSKSSVVMDSRNCLGLIHSIRESKGLISRTSHL
jgi:hypothetical protein